MLLGLSWEGLVLLVCGLLLLPRLVGVAVNLVLFAALQAQPNVRVSVAGLSLRRITEIRLELLHVALSPLLEARIVVSVDEVALTPSWSKWLTLAVRGANAQLILADTLPSKQAPTAAAASNGLPRPPPAVRKLSRAEPASIPELLSSLSSSAPPAALPPVQRGYQYICNRLLISVVHAVAVSLSSVLVIVQKDQFRATVRLASLLVYIERSSTSTARLQQLHVQLGGIEVRVGTTADADMLSYPTVEPEWTSTFTLRQRPSSDSSLESTLSPQHMVQPLRNMSVHTIAAAPPLLVLHPLQLLVEFTLHRYIPTGITRVETRAQGLNVHVDVMRLLGVASTALQAFHAVIRAAIQQQAQADDASQSSSPHSVSVNTAADSPHERPIFARGMSFVPTQTTREAALQRDQLLRYMPSFVRALVHRVSVAVYERESNALSSVASSMPGELYADLIARFGTSVSLAQGPRSLPLAPEQLQASPILRYAELHWALMAVQVDLKTRSPISDTFTEVLSSYDNHISSLEVSLNVAQGPSLYLSTAKQRPMLDVHSLKFDLSTVPAAGVSNELAAQSSSVGRGYAPLPSEKDAPTSLFHPLGTIDQQNVHALSLILVTTSIQPHPSIAHWLQFGVNVQSSAEMLQLLLPAIDERKQKSAAAQMSAEQYQRYAVREQMRRREDSLSRSRQHAATQLFADRDSRNVGLGAWRAERDNVSNNSIPDVMLVRWKQPPNALHQREAREQEAADRARRRKLGCQHHVVFTVKLISGLQVAVCSAQPGDSQPVLLLAVEEASVRIESEPYRASKHSKSDVYAQSDEFASLFSKAVIPYSISHRPPPTVPLTASSLPSFASSPPSSFSAPTSTVFSDAPREHIVISLSTLTISLPHDSQQASFLPTHPLECIKQQHRIGALNSASITIDKGSPDIVLEADGFAVKYTPAMLMVFPAVFDLLIAVIPPQLLPGFTPPPPSPSYAAPPTPPEAPSLITASYPVPQLYLKCEVRNITVDFPYTMEADAIIEEPAAPVDRSASCHASSSDPPPAAPQRPKRPSRLFTYSCGQISVSVHLPTSAWSLSLKHSYLLNEHQAFLTIQHASISGTNPTAMLPKSLSVTASNVEGEWTPPVFVDLFKLIKDMIAASVNMKHDLFGSDGLKLVPLLGSEAQPVLDWETEPVLSALALTGKRRNADVFRLWYHYKRSRWLSEPYMWVSLDVRAIRLAGYLDAEETLSAFVAVDSFGSRNLPHEFLFAGINVDILQHPLLHVDTVTLNRIGFPLYTPDNPPPPTFTEEQNLAGDWLDLALVMRNVRVELAPQMDLALLLDPIVEKIMGVLTDIWALPNIDRLSRELGGPGYLGVLLPPAPGLTMRVENMQLEVVDEPMESFLQHLHLLWLDERSEQERRRALLQLKLSKRHMGQSAEAVQAALAQIEASAGDTSMDGAGEGEAGLRTALAEYNSRMYVKKVEALKRSMREGESLKKASLLLCSLDKLSVDALQDGELGSFHDDDVMARLIQQYSAEEDTLWDGEGVELGGRSRARTNHTAADKRYGDVSFSDTPLQSVTSPSLSIASTASPGASPFTLSPSPSWSSTSHKLSPIPGTMGGRYIRVQVDVVQLRLRNFPLPLFSCSQVTVGGHMLMAEMSDNFTTSSTGARMSLQPLMAPAPALGSRSVKLSKCSRPPHIFYDMTVAVSAATVAFSPHFAYTLNDVISSIQRMAPPLPPPMFAVAPPIPVRPSDGTDVDVVAQPVNLVHFARTYLHGRMSVAVTNIALHLLSSPSPYETHRFLQVHVQSVAVSTDGPLIGLKVEDVDVIPVPHREGQPSLLELPGMECWLTLNWQCKDDTYKCEAEDDMEVDASGQYAMSQADGAEEKSFVAFDSDSMRTGVSRDVERKEVALDDEGSTRLQAQRPPALTQIASNKAASPGPLPSSPSTNLLTAPSISDGTRVHLSPPIGKQFQQQPRQHSHFGRKHQAPLSLVVADGASHCCHLHLSVSLSLAPTSGSPAPLELTLHASSLAVLYHLAMLYSHIPPLPMPSRKGLAAYYLRYHEERVRAYATSIMQELDVRGARLILMDNNINDDMIGMIKRGELDGNIFRRLLDTIAHSANITHEQITSTLLFSPKNASRAPSPQAGATAATATAAAPPSQGLVLSGAYVECLTISQLAVTVWEGEDHGPASGMRLFVDFIDVVCELQEEAGMLVVPTDALKHSKIYLPIRAGDPLQAGKAGRDEHAREVSRGYDYTRGSLSLDADNSPGLSPMRGPHSPEHTLSLPPTLAGPAPVQPLIWSLSNLTLRVSAVQADICHNAKWLEASEHDSTPATSATTNSRVVLATYENERYTLGSGWSARNLLPTDRFAWSNVTGTEEVTRESIRLPSDDWEWEGDWQLDFDLRKSGEVDEDGWEYAHDFPRHFSRVRKWYCNVRRRRWVRARQLKASLRDGAVEEELRKARKKKKQQNAQNFVFSLALLSVHQKPHMHAHGQGDEHAEYLDWRRGLFRRKVVGRRVKGGRRRGRTDGTATQPTPGMLTTSNLLSINQAPATRRAQSISSAGFSAADTSLLSYFHIRNNTDDSIVDDEEAEREATRAGELSTMASQRGPSTLAGSGGQLPMMSQTMRAVYPEGMSPMSPAPSPSLSRVVAAQLLPSSSSAPASPLLALPTQHQVRLHDPKLLLTSKIRSLLTTLAEQYGAIVQELVAADKEWLDRMRREEREKENRERLAAQEATMLRSNSDAANTTFQSFNSATKTAGATGSSTHLSSLFTLPSANTPTSARRGSFSVESTTAAGINLTGSSTLSATSSSTRNSPLTRRPRLASAEDASRRATLPVLNTGFNKDLSASPQLLLSSTNAPPSNRHATLPAGAKLPSVRDSSASHISVIGAHPSQHHSATRAHSSDMPSVVDAIDSTALPPTSTLPISRSAVSLASAGLHFNCDCHVVESATQAEAQELFCLEIINPQFNCHSEETRGRVLLITSHITVYGRVDWIHSLHLPHQDSPYATRGQSFFDDPPPVEVQATSTTPALPIVSRDRFRVTAVLDDMEAFVAPTDIDVDAGVVWMNKQNVGVLKSILQPATLQVNASFRPEMMPVSSVAVPDKLSREQQLENSLRINLNGKDSRAKKQQAEAKFVPTSHALLPPLLSAGHHHLVFSHNDSNHVDVALPQLTFALDAYQFSLLLDVIKVISAPLATSQEKDEAVDEVEDAPLVALQQRAAKQQIRLYSLVWEMKWIEWLVAGVNKDRDKWRREHVRGGSIGIVKPQQVLSAEQDEADRQVQASAASSLGSFQSWLIDATHKIEKDRQARDHHNLLDTVSHAAQHSNHHTPLRA